MGRQRTRSRTRQTEVVASEGGGGGGFDLTSLAWTGLWENFSSPPWSGTASAGSSASESLDEATHPPSVGTPLNALGVASFNGTNQFLTGDALSDFYAADAYSGVALVKITAISSDSAPSALYDNDSIVSGGAFHGVVLRDDGMAASVWVFHFDGGQQHAHVDFTKNEFVLVQWRYNGATDTLSIRTNRNSWVDNTLIADLGDLTNPIKVSHNYDTAAGFITGDLALLGLSNTVFSDTDFDNVCDGVEDAFGITLT